MKETGPAQGCLSFGSGGHTAHITTHTDSLSPFVPSSSSSFFISIFIDIIIDFYHEMIIVTITSKDNKK